MSLQVESVQVGPLPTNCYVATSAGHTLVVDPGAQPDAIVELLGERVPECILLTHCHWDHLQAIPALVARYHAPVLIHEDDAERAADKSINGGHDHAPGIDLHFDRLLHDGDTVALGDASFEVLHTPGHTPGGVCYYDAADKVLFSGDTIFAGTVGRTDFEGGDPRAMMHSAERIGKLPDDVQIYPGHDQSTTVGREHRANPFMRG